PDRKMAGKPGSVGALFSALPRRDSDQRGTQNPICNGVTFLQGTGNGAGGHVGSNSGNSLMHMRIELVPGSRRHFLQVIAVKRRCELTQSCFEPFPERFERL